MSYQSVHVDANGNMTFTVGGVQVPLLAGLSGGGILGRIYRHLWVVVGNPRELDEGHSLVLYFQDILGKHEEKDEDHSLHEYLHDIVGKHEEKDMNHSLHQYLQDILGEHYNKVIAPTGETLSTLANHFHDGHLHARSHFCPNIPLSHCGWMTSDMGFATVLINEFHGNEDLDNNGKVYGKDFKIREDRQKPFILKTLEYSAGWTEPMEIITWGEYVNYARGR